MNECMCSSSCTTAQVIKDYSTSFYKAALVPAANVYFSMGDSSAVAHEAGAILQAEVLAIEGPAPADRGLHQSQQQRDSSQSAQVSPQTSGPCAFMYCGCIVPMLFQQSSCVIPSSYSPRPVQSVLLGSAWQDVLHEDQAPILWWTWLKLLMAWQGKRIAQAQPGQGITGRQHHGGAGKEGKPVPKWMKLGKK